MHLFPIGTSRLHEPLGLIDARPDTGIAFGRMGYFHSSSQILDLLKVLLGEVRLERDTARLFFRKDQTAANPFDTALWSDAVQASVERIAQGLMRSDVLLIEVSSTRSYRLDPLHLQGNPNFYRNAPYSEVWKAGYYAAYNPELGVLTYDDDDAVADNLRQIHDRLVRLGKSAVVLGHLLDPRAPNPTRLRNNTLLRTAIEEQRLQHMAVYDPSHLVAQHGFRVLPDGSTDIHHLPWAALETEKEELLASGRRLLSASGPAAVANPVAVAC